MGLGKRAYCLSKSQQSQGLAIPENICAHTHNNGDPPSEKGHSSDLKPGQIGKHKGHLED